MAGCPCCTLWQYLSYGCANDYRFNHLRFQPAVLILPRSNTNLCQPSDRAYQLLLSRHAEWQSYFSQFPPDAQNFLRVENYIVSQLGRSVNNQAVLAIYSTQGYSSGLWGQAGYVYTSGESFVFPDSRYHSQLLTPHVYCYERLSR